jgi:ribosome maturation factor RimP
MGLFYFAYLREKAAVQKIPESIEALLQPVVESAGCEWVGGEFRGGPDGLLRVYIDTPVGVTLEDCARISDALSGVLDVEDPFPGFYRLEVSSPGVERPMFRASDFARVVGQKIRVRLHRPLAQRRRFDGIVAAVEGEQISVTIDGVADVFTFPYAEVERAHLVFEFGAPKSDHTQGGRKTRRTANNSQE